MKRAIGVVACLVKVDYNPNYTNAYEALEKAVQDADGEILNATVDEIESDEELENEGVEDDGHGTV